MAKKDPLEAGWAGTAARGADGALDRQMLNETLGPGMLAPPSRPPEPPVPPVSLSEQQVREARFRARKTHLLPPAVPGAAKLLPPKAQDTPAYLDRQYRRRVKRQGGEIA